jgi:hypothetical protein
MKYQHYTLEPARREMHALMAVLLLLVSAEWLSAKSTRKYDFEFARVVDSTQGFSDFQTFPAINNNGTVVFIAVRSGVGQGVFRSREGQVTNVATERDGFLAFGNAPAINAGGTVAFTATTNSGSTAIFRSDGLSKVLIADSQVNGLLRIGVGSPSINASGLVAFQSSLNQPGFPVSVFTGNGGPLKAVFSTSGSGFRSFGNVAINNSGTLVFSATLASGIQGVFTGRETAVAVLDTNTHPEFGGFGDPVINNAGTVADFASIFASSGIQIITGNARGVTPRNDPANPAFTNSEHPSINNHGVVAFYAFPLTNPGDPTGIFLEASGGHTLIPVIRQGDKLFGSIVTSVDLGRFALNDRMELAFQYSLNDGRSGIAIASFHGEREEDDKQEERDAAYPD